MITELEKQDFLKLQSILKPECNLFFKAVIEGTNPKNVSLLTIQTKPTSGLQGIGEFHLVANLAN
ncbi:hypothetical protein ABE354_25680 [Brevibacillus laterosporus]|uniref:hypothetical protein n=1 Tax=Brevibacillus laterosporus TaxID=1465 RepID=UPI003D20564F